MDKINVLLFAMTGFGNNAFKVLVKQPFINLSGVFTSKRQITPFPYYKCEHLYKIVQGCKIPLYEGLSFKDKVTVEIIKDLSPDLIIVSSFNQIILKTIINIPKLGIINIHPSLLPKYRGATPTVWALMNGETQTGVTAHLIENESVDQGRIISQHLLNIAPMDTDGLLRQKLAKLSEIVLREAIDRFLSGNKDLFLKQDESAATYYPKRSIRDAEIDINKPFVEILNKIRAMYPYPKAYIEREGARNDVIGVLSPNGEKFIFDGNALVYEVMVDTGTGKLTFFCERR